MAPLIILTLGLFIFVVNGLDASPGARVRARLPCRQLRERLLGRDFDQLVSWMLSAFFRGSDGRVPANASHTNAAGEEAESLEAASRASHEYCLGMLCRKGAVFLSDSRTSAGMDNITVRSKMRVFEKPGDRVICILSPGISPSHRQLWL